MTIMAAPKRAASTAASPVVGKRLAYSDCDDDPDPPRRQPREPHWAAALVAASIFVFAFAVALLVLVFFHEQRPAAPAPAPAYTWGVPPPVPTCDARNWAWPCR